MDSFRNFVKGWVGKAFLTIVVFVFVAFAFAPQFSPSGSGGEVAVVNDSKIFPRELDQAMDAMMARFGDQVDRRMLEQLVRKEAVLETLIRQRVVLGMATDLGLVANPQVVQESITSIPAFQGDDGRFSQERFQQLILANGFAGAAAFRDRVEQELLVEQLTGAIRDSAFATGPDLELVTRIADQQRDIAWTILSPAGFIGEAQATDAEVKARYDASPGNYVSEERFAIDYLELKAEDQGNDVRIDEELVKARYDGLVETARSGAERRAAHILVATGTRDVDAAKTRADEVLGKLAAGRSFAELAAEYSDDAGSAQKGGDLGFVSRGVFDSALESAVYSLKPNDVSNPVVTPDGVHIVKLLEVRELAVPTYAEARDELVGALRREEAARRFQELLDELGTLTYEAETLEEPARQLGLQVQGTGLFGRAGGPGVAANPKVMEAVLSPEVLEDGRNSGVISLGEGHAVVVRLREHDKARQLPFEDVAGRVREALLREKAAGLARAKAAELRAAVSERSLEEAAGAFGLTVRQVAQARRNSREMPAEVLQKAFVARRPAEGGITVEQVALPDGSEAVIAVSNVVDGNLLGVPVETRAQLRAQLSGQLGGVEFARLMEQATADAKIERFLQVQGDDSFSVLGAMQDLRGKYQEQRYGTPASGN